MSKSLIHISKVIFFNRSHSQDTRKVDVGFFFMIFIQSTEVVNTHRCIHTVKERGGEAQQPPVCYVKLHLLSRSFLTNSPIPSR